MPSSCLVTGAEEPIITVPPTLSPTVSPTVPPTVSPREPAAPRTDIQALRAVAVSLVLAYHLWPTRLTGGFVGVDVFLVISGFLITSHLLSRPPRRPADVAHFWARRIRRLLPASVLVLVVTLIASRLLAPETQWAATARQVRSAALHVVNWRLAGDAVDYSAAGEAASPVQHFWSLSVEEQFYLVWPVLIGAALLVAAWRRWPRRVVISTTSVGVVAVSLTYSIWASAHDPARAYFVTPTRVWELGLGGLLAVVLARPAGAPPAQLRSRPLRVGLVWLGLGAVAFAALTYSNRTPFPGWQALVPVLGAVAVIAARDPRGTGAPGRLLAWRPVQWLGDVSYSVYLWHWPLLVLLPAVSGSVGRLDRAAIVVVTLVLAALTKRFVEDRFRRAVPTGPDLTPRRFAAARPFVAAGVAMAVVSGLVTAQLTEVAHRRAADDARVAAALAHRGPCFGAAALDQPGACAAIPTAEVVPALGQAPSDQYDLTHRLRAVDDSCWAAEPRFALRTCEFGAPDAPVRVGLVGNSHAAQWLGTVEEIALRRGWHVTTMVAHHCALAVTPQQFVNAEQTQGCQDWVTDVTDRVATGDYDLVVMSNKISNRPAGQSRTQSEPGFVAGYAEVLRAWQGSGTPVVAIRDTPEPGRTVGRVPECLEQQPDRQGACGGTREDWLPPDPIEDAVRVVDDRRIRTVDLNDHLCGPDFCAPVVGGVVAYSDFSHLTTTYARTLSPYLDTALTEALRAAS